MLGTKTKQIYSYGKRNQRIVNVNDDRQKKTAPSIFDDIEPVARAPIAARMKKREHIVQSKSRTPSPKVLHINRKKRSSPTSSPSKKFARLAEILDTETIKADPISKPDIIPTTKSLGTPSRAPLAPFSLNTPGSPAFREKSRTLGVRGKPSKLKPFSPFVDVDIIVLDDSGKTVRQEKRVSRTDVQPNLVNQAVRKPVQRPSKVQAVPKDVAGDDDDDDDDEVIELKRPKRLAKRAVITVDSDSESETEGAPPSPGQRSPNTSTPTESVSTPTALSPSCSSMAGPSRSVVEVVIPPAPYVIKRTTLNGPAFEPKAPPPRYQPPSPPAVRARRLTPIRRGGGRNFYNSPLSPSPSLTSTDFDISLDFEELSTDISTSHLPKPEIPSYLKPLLAECGQSSCGPIDFSSFIETFPYDPVAQLRDAHASDLRFRKIGEASYSEVFGIGDVVLKVIPLREESGANANEKSTEDIDGDDTPAPSDARDVLKEIIVTEAMGQVCDGFVKLLKAYVVRGKYPEVLLRLWDEYHANKGSESVRPDKFLVSQVYAIIVLPNGGPDLEAYKFVSPTKVGWRQASSVFWQVAKALAHAEQLVSFEHRDLHLGQILVKDLPMPESLPLQARNQNSRSILKQSRVYMDDPMHGVRATLIDLGLSRMDAGDGDGGEMIHWTPFEEEVFMGEGDYQFDVYRMMKVHNGGAWEEFRPLTNVLVRLIRCGVQAALLTIHQWLHYLVTKLMKSKRLKVPVVSRASPVTEAAAFTEKNCYDCLVDIESWLRACVSAFAPPPKAKGRGKKKMLAAVPSQPIAPLSGPACAGEVVAYAVKKGWIQPTV
ncbi:hypothetical protein DXG01_006008 [Tephrocybe rancida]|nr:hypothetical protein DXG01_006008 [Tephrocybe rancida]